MSAQEEEEYIPVIGITTGDLNGIGLEVIVKTFSDPRVAQYCTPVLYANAGTVNFYRKVLDVKNFNFNIIKSAHEAQPGKLNLINSWQDNVRINFGQPSKEAGQYAFVSLQHAVDDAKLGLLDAIVTAPIDKSSIRSENFDFPGHTEYLTREFNAQDSLMFLVGEEFRIGVVTGHLPLAQVAPMLSEARILDKLHMMHHSLITDFNIRKPVIAVLGLNPHAGEGGLLGNEENDIIIPAIEKANSQDMLVKGPFPADGFFGTHMYRNFDAVLAMYHDQGLVPFKLLNFETGVNYTAGLQVVRTSPDHGTGYGIAGKNMANEQSFREAVFTAREILKNRRLYEEVNKDPLTSQVIKEKEL